MKKVLAFGSFDPMHEGHVNFLEQARALGDHLTVVVARDRTLLQQKGREPRASEEKRLTRVAKVRAVGRAIIGSEQVEAYDLLGELEFDVVVLGYDQEPSDDRVREELDKIGKRDVKVVRLQSYKPDIYKSSILSHHPKII